jgi:predicted nucleic acid-binding protein
MEFFPDTSFLCSRYREQIFSPRVDAWMDAHPAPLPVSTFLLLEFRQSTRLQVRLFENDRTKGFGQREATAMLRDLQQDLSLGILEVRPVDWPDVHQIAERLSAMHTSAAGHRLADILHVATAIHLGMAGFLTFDDRQRALAEAEGLTVPL